MNTPNSDREYDLVVFGATGFTGELVAEYLASNADPNTRWAIAGRNADKLQAVRERLGLSDAVDTLVVDTNDPEALATMTASSRVVCTTVGPYARLGTHLLRACAEAGTHYCDLTGEVQWMAEVFEEINPIAQTSGARLVHCCGFDSIPFDLGVFTAQKAMHERHGTYATQVRGRMGKSRGGLSGGTAASMMLMMEQASKNADTRKRLMDPYSLYPPGTEPGVDGGDRLSPSYDKVFERWTAPFMMAPCNTRVIRRSNALAGFPYGEDFSYEEAMLVKGPLQGAAIAGGMGGFGAVAILAPGRALLNRVLPDPGTGPSPEDRERGFFEYFAHAHHPKDSAKDVRVKVTGKRDPGYGATSRMLAQSALCLAHDPLAVDGGIWTTASAMGQHLIDRLAGVDVVFEVLD